jgi:hypothetical protein
MTTEKETLYHINRCLKRIEQHLGWGDSVNWTNYDFSKLSDEVHNRTQVRLSTTTLKRIWSRLKYDSAPTITTLNALAQFAGYSDWRHFCKEDVVTVESGSPQPAVASANVESVGTQKRRYWPVVAIPLVIGAAFVILQGKEKARVDPAQFEFQANKVISDGVPNSVVFTYDATAANTDSVFIVQTWDIRRKKLVSRDNHNHSAMYYYPGFFRTKLIVGTDIVKTHDLWITSGGWLGVMEQDPVPLYFNKEEIVFDDRVEVDAALLSKYNLTLHPQPPRLRIFNQRDMGDIMSDNFAFETNVKTEFSEGAGACQFVQILIQCKDDVVGIMVGAKPCVGEMELYFCGAHASAKDADMSGFGADLSEWTNVRVETVNKNATILVNGRKAYSLTFPHEATGVVGVQYRFNGVGAVKDTWFQTNDRIVKL